MTPRNTILTDDDLAREEQGVRLSGELLTYVLGWYAAGATCIWAAEQLRIARARNRPIEVDDETAAQELPLWERSE